MNTIFKSFNIPLDEDIKIDIEIFKDEEKSLIGLFKESRDTINTEEYKKIVKEYNENRSKRFEVKEKEFNTGLKEITNTSEVIFYSLPEAIKQKFKNKDFKISGTSLLEKTIEYRAFAKENIAIIEASVESLYGDKKLTKKSTIPSKNKKDNLPILEAIEKLEDLIQTFDDIIEYAGGE